MLSFGGVMLAGGATRAGRRCTSGVVDININK